MSKLNAGSIVFLSLAGRIGLKTIFLPLINTRTLKNTLPSPETGPEEQTQHPRLKPVLVLRQQRSWSSLQVTFEVRKRLSCQGTKVHQIASLLPTHSHEIKAKFFLDAFCCTPSLYRLHCPEHSELSHASK